MKQKSGHKPTFIFKSVHKIPNFPHRLLDYLGHYLIYFRLRDGLRILLDSQRKFRLRVYARTASFHRYLLSDTHFSYDLSRFLASFLFCHSEYYRNYSLHKAQGLQLVTIFQISYSQRSQPPVAWVFILKLQRPQFLLFRKEYYNCIL